MSYRIIGDQRQIGLAWATERLDLGAGITWDKASCLILEKAGDITAVAVYNNWIPENSVEISIASVGGNWLTRPFLAAVFRAPFVEWKMRRATSSIAEDNLRSIRFCERLGFQREGRIRQAAPNGKDLLIYGLLKSECRWGEVNEQGISTGCTRSDSYGVGANEL